ncbi:MAG: histidinol dehydrogenase [Alphaproteobacteria bacterium]|nr:histidinol dehydrogenase [Alphaproteobacteria bacterium]
MKIINWSELDGAARTQALQRPAAATSDNIAAAVRVIVQMVQAGGEQALFDLTEKYDGVRLRALRADAAEIAAGCAMVPAALRAAIDTAAANIEKFHAAQKPRDYTLETMPGVQCSQLWRPLGCAGLYVPGGTAPLFSTVLMLGIPAQIAGCAARVLCTPPQKDGGINPAILYAAQRCGIETIYKIGGAQAIAAMAYGLGGVPKADKVFGPGNAYVTAAKQWVAQDPSGAAIDMPAGPSEVMVLADGGADARFIAADLLSQAEHGRDSQVFCCVTDAALAQDIQQAVDAQLADLPRKDIAAEALAQSRIVVVGDMKEAIGIANGYGPEHLIVQCAGAEEIVPHIRNAGSVFVGAWTPEVVGDYASGTNHVLPTYGAARAIGGLGVASFMKSMTVQQLSREGLAALGPVVATLAEAEQLSAHGRAVTIRLSAEGEKPCAKRA